MYHHVGLNKSLQDSSLFLTTCLFVMRVKDVKIGDCFLWGLSLKVRVTMKEKTTVDLCVPVRICSIRQFS